MKFNELKLGEISKITKLAGFEFTKYFEYDDSGEIIAIRALNVKNGTLDLTEIKRISKKISENLNRSKLYKNDIILTYTGANLGEVAIIYENDKYHLAPNVSKLTVNEDVDPYFVFCFLRSDRFRQQISNYSVGSSQPTIPMNTIRELTIPIPDRETQKRIVNTIYPIDKKIELNRQLNQTLESIASAIFKSWFVDFDPVYAKMEGRDYPLPPEIMDLFPDELEESELGLIPKGWKISSLEKIADYLNGLALQKYPPENDKDKLPVIKIRELRSGSPDDQSNFATSNLPDEYVINDGDILFSWSGSLLVRMWCGGKGALNQHLFKVTSKKYPKWFYYLWTEHHLKEFQRIAADKATTMGHIKRHHLQDAKVITPNSKLIELGTQYVYSIIEKILLNSKIENLLIQKRELLLPKLISGEIEV